MPPKQWLGSIFTSVRLSALASFRLFVCYMYQQFVSLKGRSARAMNICACLPACNLSQLSILMGIGFGCVPISPLQATR